MTHRQRHVWLFDEIRCDDCGTPHPEHFDDPIESRDLDDLGFGWKVVKVEGMALSMSQVPPAFYCRAHADDHPDVRIARRGYHPNPEEFPL